MNFHFDFELDANGENGNMDYANNSAKTTDVNPNYDLGLQNLNISVQNSIKDCFYQLTNTPQSSPVRPSSPSKTITQSTKWAHPKSFGKETIENQISLIVKWIYGADKASEGVLNGANKIVNITMHLEKMNYNRYLRLFEVDMEVVRKYMSVSSWTLFEDFKKKHLQDIWICPHCSTFLEQTIKWKCERCLFWYHEKCTKAQKIANSNENITLCNACLFALQ